MGYSCTTRRNQKNILHFIYLNNLNHAKGKMSQIILCNELNSMIILKRKKESLQIKTSKKYDCTKKSDGKEIGEQGA